MAHPPTQWPPFGATHTSSSDTNSTVERYFGTAGRYFGHPRCLRSRRLRPPAAEARPSPGEPRDPRPPAPAAPLIRPPRRPAERPASEAALDRSSGRSCGLIGAPEFWGVCGVRTGVRGRSSAVARATRAGRGEPGPADGSPDWATAALRVARAHRRQAARRVHPRSALSRTPIGTVARTPIATPPSRRLAISGRQGLRIGRPMRNPDRQDSASAGPCRNPVGRSPQRVAPDLPDRRRRAARTRSSAHPAGRATSQAAPSGRAWPRCRR
jgi:hypothetical protein